MSDAVIICGMVCVTALAAFLLVKYTVGNPDYLEDEERQAGCLMVGFVAGIALAVLLFSIQSYLGRI